MRLRVLPQAELDIDAIVLAMAAESPPSAERFLFAIRRTLEGLLEMPRKGRLCGLGSGRFERVRMIAVSGFRNYIIYYEGGRDRVLVVRVIHSARNREAVLRGRK
jgi:toxin ParE1/3/4